MYGYSGAEWKVRSWSEVTGGPSGDDTARSEVSVDPDTVQPQSLHDGDRTEQVFWKKQITWELPGI